MCSFYAFLVKNLENKYIIIEANIKVSSDWEYFIFLLSNRRNATMSTQYKMIYHKMKNESFNLTIAVSSVVKALEIPLPVHSVFNL